MSESKLCPIMTNGYANQVDAVYSGVPCVKEQCQLWIEMVNSLTRRRHHGCAFALQARADGDEYVASRITNQPEG